MSSIRTLALFQSTEGRRRHGFWVFACGLVGTLMGSGCMTTFQATKMRAGLADAGDRLDRIDKLEKKHREEVVQLSEVLDRATALLAASSGDVGAKEERTEKAIVALGARLDQLGTALAERSRQEADDQTRREGRVAALEQVQAKLAHKIAQLLPDDKEQLWRGAQQGMSAGDREKERRYYRAFVERFPQDARAPLGYLNVGLSFVQEKRFANAVAEFEGFLAKYPGSAQAPEAMWQLSQAFLQLHFCTDARSLLSDLVRRYPKTPSATDAHKEMKTIRRLPRAACTS